MPRCHDIWIRKGQTTVEVSVQPPDDPPFYVLQVLTYPRKSDPTFDPVYYDSVDLAQGAIWTVPADYRCVFSLLSTGNAGLDTSIQLAGKPAACSAGNHCQGACTPDGKAGLAGYWTLTTWESE